jgi:hypothetical protein
VERSNNSWRPRGDRGRKPVAWRGEAGRGGVSVCLCVFVCVRVCGGVGGRGCGRAKEPLSPNAHVWSRGASPRHPVPSPGIPGAQQLNKASIVGALRPRTDLNITHETARTLYLRGPVRCSGAGDVAGPLATRAQKSADIALISVPVIDSRCPTVAFTSLASSNARPTLHSHS